METEKNDKSVNTRIPTSTWEWLVSYGTAGSTIKMILQEAEEADKAGIPIDKIADSLQELQMIRRRSQAELKGVFTPEEWSLMADSLNGTMTTQEFRCIPGALTASVEDSDLYDGLGAKWEVDTKKLIYKIEDLTAAQVDAVFTRIEAFWNDEHRDLEQWSKW